MYNVRNYLMLFVISLCAFCKSLNVVLDEKNIKLSYLYFMIHINTAIRLQTRYVILFARLCVLQVDIYSMDKYRVVCHYLSMS